MSRAHLFALLIFMALNFGARAHAADTVKFNTYPHSGTAFNIVVKEWKKVPEYKFYVDATGGVPSFDLGLADVNGDGKPEIFARNNNDELGFCTKDGVACQMHIYAVTSQGVVEIGKMMAGSPVSIADTKTDAVSDLVIRGKDNKLYMYVWRKNRYELK